MVSDYHLGILDLRFLVSPLVCPVIYGFWLPLWSVLWFTVSGYPFGLSCDLRFLVTPLVCPVIYGFWLALGLSCDLRFLVSPLVCPVIYGFWLPLWYLRFTVSDYPFGILDIRFLIIPLVSSKCSWSGSCKVGLERKEVGDESLHKTNVYLWAYEFYSIQP